jgi:hypothetical protein
VQPKDSIPIVVAGHSNVICFGIKPKAGPAQLIELRAEPRILGVQAPFLSLDSDAFAKVVCTLATGHHLAVLWAGWTDLLFMCDPPFDFVSSEFPGLPLEPRATPVPESMVLAHDAFRHYPSMMAHFLKQFREAPVRDLTVLCPPPPKRSNDVIRQRMLSGEKFWANWAKERGFDVRSAPITPPFIRLKFWGLIHQLIRAAAREAGATYLPVPREAQDEHGFLREEYSHTDVVHANEQYGRLYLDHLVDALRLKQPARH